MSCTIKIHKSRSFGVVYDDIMEDRRMSMETRFILGWLTSLPDGWEVRVGHVQRVLGMSERKWVKARKEMESFGYYRQRRYRNTEGKFVWEITVSDTPMLDVGDENKNAIPPKPQDGSKRRKTILPKTMDGSAMHGQCGDITTSSNQDHINTPTPKPDTHEISQQCRVDAGRAFEGHDIDQLISEWRGASLRKGAPPKYPDKAFLAWAGRYVINHPLQASKSESSSDKRTLVEELSIPPVPLRACQAAIGKLAESDQAAKSLGLQIGFFRHDASGLGFIRVVTPNRASQRLAGKNLKLVEIIKTAFQVNRIEWNISPAHFEALAAKGRLGLSGVWALGQGRGGTSLYVVH